MEQRAAAATQVRRLRDSAAKVAADLDPVGGWGLRAGQGPSTVNTTEALWVFVAAHAQDQGQARAIEYISDNLPHHCRPRGSGPDARGEKTRIVTFGLAGLGLRPNLWTSQTPETVRWGLDWLTAQARDDGWPEVAGSTDASIFQTAVAAYASAQLADCGADVTVQRTRDLEAIARTAIAGLLYHWVPGKGWPNRTYAERVSPAKTAWAIIGLDALSSAVTLEHLTQQRYPNGAAALTTTSIDEALSDACRWLIANSALWSGRTELDPDVPGTEWTHLAHQLCLLALTRRAPDPFATALHTSWHDFNALWDDAAGTWLERRRDERIDTVRMSAFSGLTLSAVSKRLGDDGLALLDSFRAARKGPYPYEIETTPLSTWHLIHPQSGQRWSLGAVGPTGLKLLEALAPDFSDLGWVGTAAVAGSTSPPLAQSSVGQAVARFNKSVSTITDGVVKNLVLSERGRGYRLAAAHRLKAVE